MIRCKKCNNYYDNFFQSSEFQKCPICNTINEETKMTGIEIIAKEREEQMTKHWKTVDYDVKNNDNGRLIQAALFALTLDDDKYPDWDDTFKNSIKKKQDDLIECASIAGALIAAEIDRLLELKRIKELPEVDNIDEE